MSRLAAVLLGTIFLYLIFFHRSEPTFEKKLVLEVETPHGIVSASTIVELKSFKVPWWYPVGGIRSGQEARGEALHLDLGDGRNLFMAMNDWGSRSIKNSIRPNHLEADGRIKADAMPLFITFGNIDDANSVREVAPADLASTFGAGYALRSLRVVDTTDKPSFGALARRFPRLKAQLSLPPVERYPQPLSPAGDDELLLRKIDWSYLSTQLV